MPPFLNLWVQALNYSVLSAYVSANDENGERILHTAPSSPLPKAPALPPKQGESPSQPHHHRQTEVIMTAVVLMQIVGPAVPFLGLPPQTAVSWPRRCRPRPPTQWDDSFSPLHRSHRVSGCRTPPPVQSIQVFELKMYFLINSTKRGTQNEAGEEASQPGVTASKPFWLQLHSACALLGRRGTTSISTFCSGFIGLVWCIISGLRTAW